MALSFALLGAPFPPPAAAQSGPRPGASDPVANASRRTMFRDDEIFAVVPHFAVNSDSQEYSLDTVTANADQTALTDLTPIPENFSLENSSAVMAAAAGRILAPDKDQVVTASRHQSDLLLHFPVGEGGTDYSLGGFAAPPDYSTEFMDLAVSDLDKLPDANSINHDEVIVCYIGTDTSNSAHRTVQLAVLDYAG